MKLDFGNFMNKLFDAANSLTSNMSSSINNLLSKNEAQSSSETNKTTSTSWFGWFGKESASTPGFNSSSTLLQSARLSNVSEADVNAQLLREAARHNLTNNVTAASLSNASSATSVRWGEGLRKDGGYTAKVTPQDLGKERWSAEINPADIAKAGMKRAAINTGIAANDAEASRIVEKMQIGGLTHEVAGGKQAMTTPEHLNVRGWLKDQLDQQGQYPINVTPELMQEMRETAKQLALEPVKTPQPAELSTETAVLGVGAITARALPQLPKVANPATLMVGAGIAGTGALIYKSTEIAHENWQDRQRERVLPPLTMPPLRMEDVGEAPPFARPTDTAEKQSQSNPLPTDAELPKGELVRQPPANPTTQEAQPNTTSQAQPNTSAQPTTQQPTQPTAPQQKDPRKIDPKKIGKAIAAGAAGTAAGIGSKEAVDSIQNSDQPGVYTTKIAWGNGQIPARPSGKGFWGQRTQQSDPRVNAYELKINPNNESYYIQHPNGRYIQFENIDKKALQDGKLVKQVNNSIYNVYDKPDFLRKNVLDEATKQVKAAKHNGLEVEWIVSNEETIKHLKKFFKEHNLDIKLTYLPE